MTPGTLAWLVLAYAAGMGIISVAGNLAGHARRAGHPALGNFTEWASLPVSVASLSGRLGTSPAPGRLDDPPASLEFLLVYAVCAVWRNLRQRRKNARPPVEPLT